MRVNRSLDLKARYRRERLRKAILRNEKHVLGVRLDARLSSVMAKNGTT
jgi:hypothetical protein